MSLSDAVIGLKAYKEVDQRMALLWHAMDAALILPRTSARENQFSAIKLDNVSAGQERDRTRLLTILTGNLEIARSSRSGNFVAIQRLIPGFDISVKPPSQGTSPITFKCNDARSDTSAHQHLARPSSSDISRRYAQLPIRYRHSSGVL